MSYVHKGKVLDNGLVEMKTVSAGSPELTVLSADDGLHLTEPHKGDFEWWYFDVLDTRNAVFLKVVFHIGTDPLKTKIFPQLAVSLNFPSVSEHFTREYTLTDIEADTSQCHIRVGDEINILALPGKETTYLVKINLPEFYCDLHFTCTTEGWKPLGDQVQHRKGKKKGAFAWVIPVPEARAKGELAYKNFKHFFSEAIGYHDHNYIKADKKNPLHLDKLVTHWYWGKGYAGPFTMIFMDTWFRADRILSLLIAENGKIIHSSNNLLRCEITVTGHDRRYNSAYPVALSLELQDETLPVKILFDSAEMLDQRDLLYGVNPVLKTIIRAFIAKPVYYSFRSNVSLIIRDLKLEGTGNYEVMAFKTLHY